MLQYFVKLSRSGDSEGPLRFFESSYHLLLPVKPLKGKCNPIKCLANCPRTQQTNFPAYLHTVPLMLNKVRKL